MPSLAWFEALLQLNPQQALQTAAVLLATGRADGCSICGDHPAPIYDLDEEPQLPVRLCSDCVTIQASVLGTPLRHRSVVTGPRR